MTITRTQNGNTLNIALEGRLDTISAPDFKETLDNSAKSAEKLIVDFEKVEYISSAGLRVILYAHQMMSSKGGLTLTHVNEIIREVFEVTGVADILSIE